MASEYEDIQGLSTNPNPIVSTNSGKPNVEQTKEEEQRDVLEGGIMTMLFPGYGGARARIVVRILVFLALIFVGIYVYNRYFKKTTTV